MQQENIEAIASQLTTPTVVNINENADELIDTNQKSAKQAIKILLETSQGFKVLNATERRNLAMAFASQEKIIYGKAFDLIKILNGRDVDFNNLDDVIKNLKNIVVCEIKSTRKKTNKENFEGYFFGLTTAELLVAQNLKNSYKFVFVNINTKNYIELTLAQVFGKAKAIYPQWSITF